MWSPPAPIFPGFKTRVTHTLIAGLTKALSRLNPQDRVFPIFPTEYRTAQQPFSGFDAIGVRLRAFFFDCYCVPTNEELVDDLIPKLVAMYICHTHGGRRQPHTRPVFRVLWRLDADPLIIGVGHRNRADVGIEIVQH